MRLEHFAYNATDPVAMCDWYEKHLGFKLVRQGPGPAFTSFIQDPGTGMMIEFYHQPSAAIPDYRSQNALTLHIAFATEDTAGVKTALTAAGAATLDEFTLPDGSRILMMRDPFGLCLQFCHRTPSFFT